MKVFLRQTTFCLCVVLSSGVCYAAQDEEGKSRVTKPSPKIPAKEPQPSAPPRTPPRVPPRVPVTPSAPTVVRPTTPARPGRSRDVTTADLTINAYQPGATVLVNGRSRGPTKRDGLLNVPSLKAGQYIVIVRKPNHREEQRSVTLYPGQSFVLEVKLRGLPGRLSVMPSVADARIEINNVGSYNGRVSNLELDAGNYEVTVSKPGYRAVTRAVNINSNAPTTISVPLAAITVGEMLSDAERDFRSRNFNRVIANCEAILAMQPDQPQANVWIGLSHFYSERYSDSTPYLQKAIALGEQVILPIKHHHRVVVSILPSDNLCTGILKIGKGVIAFETGRGGDEDFSVSASKIAQVKAEPNKAGRIHVEILIQKPGKKKEEKKTYNFHTAHTVTRDPTPGDTNSAEYVTCNNCQPEMQVVYQLLLHLKEPSSKDIERPTLRPVQSVSETTDLSSPTGGASSLGRISPPSTRYRNYTSDKYKLSIPDNWKETASSTRSVIFAPDGAHTKVGARNDISHGLMVGLFPAQGKKLPQAFEQFVNAILRDSSYLRRLGVNQGSNIKGREGLSVPLGGTSPASNREEFARIHTVMMRNGDLFYVIAVSPKEDSSSYGTTFANVVGSIDFLD